MDSEPKKTERLRERKRRETLHRIAEIGLKLFAENGYDATTLEAIAAAAGISARTFFYYFKTKDDVLRFWQGSGFLQALGPAMLEEPADQAPLDAVRNCLLKLSSRYETEKSIVVDRILNSSETLRARKQATYLQMEQTLFDALCRLWPEPERRKALRMVAMVSIGAMRLAMEARRQDADMRPLAEHLRESFAVLESQI
jgi:AcrR family transcriptional regulator